MTPLWALLPGIQASSSRYAARHQVGDSRTVLGVKGPLRRGPNRRALDSCAPFCRNQNLRRAAPPGTRSNQVLRLIETRTDGSRQTS
jgi:hypothetical protein